MQFVDSCCLAQSHLTALSITWSCRLETFAIRTGADGADLRKHRFNCLPAAYIADQLEAWTLSNLRMNSKFPDIQTLVPKDELDNVTEEFPTRSNKMMQKVRMATVYARSDWLLTHQTTKNTRAWGVTGPHPMCSSRLCHTSAYAVLYRSRHDHCCNCLLIPTLQIVDAQVNLGTVWCSQHSSHIRSASTFQTVTVACVSKRTSFEPNISAWFSVQSRSDCYSLMPIS